MYKHLKEEYKEHGVRLCSLVSRNGARGRGHKLKHSEGDWLLREIVESLPWKYSGAYLHGLGQAVSGGPCLGRGVGPGDLQSASKPQVFCCVDLQGLQWYQWVTLCCTSWCQVSSL